MPPAEIPVGSSTSAEPTAASTAAPLMPETAPAETVQVAGGINPQELGQPLSPVASKDGFWKESAQAADQKEEGKLAKFMNMIGGLNPIAAKKVDTQAETVQVPEGITPLEASAITPQEQIPVVQPDQTPAAPQEPVQLESAQPLSTVPSEPSQPADAGMVSSTGIVPEAVASVSTEEPAAPIEETPVSQAPVVEPLSVDSGSVAPASDVDTMVKDLPPAIPQAAQNLGLSGEELPVSAPAEPAPASAEVPQVEVPSAAEAKVEEPTMIHPELQGHVDTLTQLNQQADLLHQQTGDLHKQTSAVIANMQEYSSATNVQPSSPSVSPSVVEPQPVAA